MINKIYYFVAYSHFINDYKKDVHLETIQRAAFDHYPNQFEENWEIYDDTNVPTFVLKALNLLH